jgi:hypothetical protein
VHIVKNMFNHMASIKGYDDEARPGDAGGFHNQFAARVPEDQLSTSDTAGPSVRNRTGLRDRFPRPLKSRGG